MFILVTQPCSQRQAGEAAGQAWDGDPPQQHMFSVGFAARFWGLLSWQAWMSKCIYRKNREILLLAGDTTGFSASPLGTWMPKPGASSLPEVPQGDHAS